MNFFGSIYDLLVYRPLLNILQALYNITGDTGISIIVLGVIVNLFMVPLFAQAYINGQKVRVLQPLTSQLREQYKDNPQEMLKQLGEFNKKHGIRNNSVFLVLIFQLLFATGLWSLTRRISDAQTVNGVVEIPGLYVELFGRELTNFSKIAFSFINIGDSANQYIWLPILAAFLSFLYGYYTFKIAPKPKLLPKKPQPKNNESSTQPSPFDPETFQKSMEIQTIYVLPAIMFVFNLGLTTGVNIYFTTVSLFSLIRQIVLTNYYAGHTDKLVDEIINSDPSLTDGDLSNSLATDSTDDTIVQEEVPELVISNPQTPSVATKAGKKSKKQVAKKSKKPVKKTSKK